MNFMEIFEQACDGNEQLLVDCKQQLISQNKLMGMSFYEARDSALTTIAVMGKVIRKK